MIEKKRRAYEECIYKRGTLQEKEKMCKTWKVEKEELNDEKLY